MRKALLVVGATLSCLFAAPAPASAHHNMEVALQDDAVFLYRGAWLGQYFSRETAFEKMRAMHGSVLRVNVIWAFAVADDQAHLKSKPAKVEYDWAGYDSLVNLARGYGVKVQFTLTGPAPAWATPTKSVAKGYIKPNARQFGKFTRDAARHFRGRVSRYAIWNEPNWRTWLGPRKQAPLLYRELYRKAYKNIKRAQPKAQILIGELAPYKNGKASTAPLLFMRKATCVNGKYQRKKGGKCGRKPLRADGFAHHPYDFVRPPHEPHPGRDNITMGSLGRLTKALDKLKRAGVLKPRRSKRMPVYLTEFGYFRAGERRIPEGRRAKWTRQGFEIARKNRRVKQVLQYVFVQPPGGIFFDLSILDHTGAETPVYKALVRWSSAKKRHLKRPGRRRSGVNDENPPAPPGSGKPPPADPPPAGEPPAEPPPPEEPDCAIVVPEGFPCPLENLLTG